MKRVFSLLLVFVICLSLCACGKSEAVINFESSVEQIGMVSIDSEDKISAAEEAYKVLTDKEKESVAEGHAILTEKRDAFEEEKKIASVVALIEAIGDVTLNSEAAINDAEKHFNKLTEDQKEKVTNADKLSAAKDKYNSLLCENCISKINAIGTVTLYNQQAIVEAEACYNKLSADYKKKITNHNILLEARNEYTRLEKEAAEEAKKLSPNDLFNNGSWEITYKKTSLSTRITPDKKKSFYLYYGCDDDEIIVDVVFTIKNISGDELKVLGIVDNVVVTYNDKYTYDNYRTIYSISDDIDVAYDWDSIEPLKTATLHIGMWIPRTAKTDDGPLKVKLNILGEEKIIIVK